MDEKGTMQVAVKKSGRSHFLCEKAPGLVMTVGAYLISLVFPLVGLVAVAISQFVLPPFERQTGEGLAVALSAFLLVWMYNRWFAPEYEGSMRIHVPYSDVLRWSIPFWVCMSGSVLIEAFAKGEFYFQLNFSMVALCMSAGFLEEAIYRAFIVPIGMRYLSGENRVWWTMGISAGVFALAHASNVLAGAAVDMTVFQVIACVPFGLYAAALTLRSGCFLPAAILHTMLDIIGMGTTPNAGDGVLRGTIGWSDITSVGLEYIFLVSFAFLLVKACKTEILALWEKKWGMEPEETEEY